MTQKDLVIAYCEMYGSINPAKIKGTPFGDGFFGSETPKRCRELRQEGKLISHSEGKFEVFELAEKSLYGTGQYDEGGYEYKKQELENKLLTKALTPPGYVSKETAREGQVLIRGNWYKIV